MALNLDMLDKKKSSKRYWTTDEVSLLAVGWRACDLPFNLPSDYKHAHFYPSIISENAELEAEIYEFGYFWRYIHP